MYYILVVGAGFRYCYYDMLINHSLPITSNEDIISVISH